MLDVHIEVDLDFDVVAACIWWRLGFGLFFTLYTLFVRFLPQVAIAEVKSVMPEASPHYEGWGHHDGDHAEQGAH